MNKNEELVLRIGKHIEHHRNLEVDQYAINLAVGLANVKYSGENFRFWITNVENNRNLIFQKGLGGNTSIITSRKTTVEDDGKPIYKNSKIGECIIRNSSGIHKVIVPAGEKMLEIYNTTFYTPSSHTADAIDVKLNINEAKPRIYRSLESLLSKVKEVDAEIIKLEKERAFLQEKDTEKDNEELLNILKKIEAAERQRKDTLSKAQTFIRKNAELRYQPILDPWQDEIKRSNLFNATIAIDGGPGTGKTTSLIQRIKFLTDKDAIKEYLPNLKQEQYDKLFDEDANWMFFSPSELLKLFLRNSMLSEGLKADDKRVLVWEDYKGFLIKKYKLINSETQNPFLVLRKDNDKMLLPFKSNYLKNIINSFDGYYLAFQEASLEKIRQLDVSGFTWRNKGLSIQNFLKRQEKINSFESLIRLYFNLQDNFAAEVSDFSKEFNVTIKNGTARIIVELNKNEIEKERLIELVSGWINETKQEEDEEIDGDTIIEDDQQQEVLDPEEVLFNKLKTLLRKKALLHYDKSIKISSREKELESIVTGIYNLELSEDFEKIGQYAFFIKYFERSTQGIVSNLFIDIPKLYKAFRKEEFKNKNNKWNFEILGNILENQEPKNKRLHSNEQAFLIYFINNLIKKCFKTSKVKAMNINHPYFEAYKELSRPVIGVDEATDFHLIDLLSIHSLSDWEISSVTYSGDLMQRLTNAGIRNWDELKPFIKNFEKKSLQISYRQSPTLLGIAETIYNKATNLDAEYVSFMDKDENEPAPLLYINDDEDMCIEWISKRILEIYKAYGSSIPSIAIFLNKEEEIDEFAKKLGDIDRLADVGIQVKGSNKGQVLGDINTVRIFSIEYIKGLEFEAVFFHKINELYDLSNKEMVLKNLYVGLSRASFYLGVTSGYNTNGLSIIKDLFLSEETTWRI